MTAAALIKRRFGDLRPGLQLLGVVDAAVPVTIVRVDVLAQERKDLPLLEEFILRFVHSGVANIDELAGLLGLQRDQVITAAAELISKGNLIQKPNGALSLTELGKEAARDLASVQPVLSQLSVQFDRVLWSIQDYPRSSLIKKRDAQDEGRELLPAKKRSRVSLVDLPVERFNELVDSRSDRTRGVEVLRVRKIAAQAQHLFMPAELLVYGDPASGQVELGLCIDGDLRPEHGLEFAASNAVEKIGISVAKPEPRPTLEPELEEQRVSSEQIEVMKAAAGTGQPAADAGTPPLPVAELPVRSVDVFEHPELLEKALNQSATRLLIISPWVKGAVVNTNFIAALERRLRAGVKVHIGHGIGNDDSGSDEFALRKLHNLANRFRSNFNLVRLENTHAKILIFDDVWVNTSFNWLSFRGDPNRTFRMEEGTLVQIPEQVDKAFQHYVEVLDRKGADPRHSPVD
jgi:hypothetical protein